MKFIDLHSHWGTRRGYLLRTEEELATQKKVWNSEPRYETEEEMADYFRKVGVRTILDFAFTKDLPMSQVRSLREVTQASFAGQQVKLGPGRAAVYRGIETPIDLTALIEGVPSAFEFHTVIAGSRARRGAGPSRRAGWPRWRAGRRRSCRCDPSRRRRRSGRRSRRRPRPTGSTRS